MKKRVLFLKSQNRQDDNNTYPAPHIPDVLRAGLGPRAEDGHDALLEEVARLLLGGERVVHGNVNDFRLDLDPRQDVPVPVDPHDGVPKGELVLPVPVLQETGF